MWRWIALVAAIVLICAIAGGIVSQSLSPPTEQQAPQAQEIRGTSLWDRWFPDPIAVYTLFLAIFTMVLALGGLIQLNFLNRAEGLALKNANAAKDAADTARDALIAANRAWVEVKIEVGSPITYNVNGLNLALKYHLKNIGRSPATNIFVNANMLAPAIGIDEPFDPMSELNKIIDRTKAQPRAGSIALFPDEQGTFIVTTGINADELKRLTQKAKFITPYVIGTVEYRMGLDTKVHQTGFVLEIRRSDAPRPVSTEKNRSPRAIFPDEGEVPFQDVVILRSLFEGGYAD
jgi:hypothetical protein